MTRSLAFLSPLAAVLVLGVAACTRETPSAAGPAADAPPKRLSIAVVPKGTSHEFWKSVEAGAIKAGRELDVDVMWKGPAREDDRDDQIKVIEDFTTRGVDGIVVAPLDNRALVRPLAEARAGGARIAIIDSGLDWDGYETFVATDNERGGRLAARELGRLLDGKGRVVMVRYVEGSLSTTQREEGFLDELRTAFPEVEIVSSDQYGGATLESCYRTAENLLNRYPEIDGAYGPNEPSAAALMKALVDAKRRESVKLVGFDASAALVTGLRDGQIDALVVQNPFRMGELGVTTLVRSLRGEPVEKRVDTGCTLVTRENMEEPAVAQLLAPDLSPWLE